MRFVMPSLVIRAMTKALTLVIPLAKAAPCIRQHSAAAAAGANAVCVALAAAAAAAAGWFRGLVGGFR